MKICLTGSTGFVGSKLCAHLLENSHEIFAPVRNINLTSLPSHKNLRLIHVEDKGADKDYSKSLIHADLIIVGQFNTSKIIRYVKSNQFKSGLFFKGWCPPHPTFFVRRSVYESLGNFDLNYHIASDVELMMRFLEIHKIKSRYIPEVWVKMRNGGHSNQNLKNIWLQNIEIFNSFRKNGLSVNPISFFVYKIISRFKQFYKKQS